MGNFAQWIRKPFIHCLTFDTWCHMLLNKTANMWLFVIYIAGVYPHLFLESIFFVSADLYDDVCVLYVCEND